MNQDIFVVIEHLQGQVAEISYTMLATARDAVQVSRSQGVSLAANRFNTPRVKPPKKQTTEHKQDEPQIRRPDSPDNEEPRG